MDIRFDCRHFKGTVPCQFHKNHGVECNSNCQYYDSTNGNILLIKLGAMGDVIRTTPLLSRLKSDFPNFRIFWLTKYVDSLPEDVDIPLPFTIASLTYIKSVKFDIGINLDKEREACALMNQLDIKKTYGFGLKHGMSAPLNENANHKFLTGINDTYSKKNNQHYLEEIFSICGYSYAGEEYILPEAKSSPKISNMDKSKTIIGLNTGCGARWTSRQWPEKHWLTLATILMKKDYSVLLLGGQEEDKMNKNIANKSGAIYLGYFPFTEFIHLVDICNIVVTSVTMAMHVAIGLKKRLILLNNIFNPNEFHFFRESIILKPEKECECYYKPVCINNISCIEEISAKKVFYSIEELIKK
jgi:heptosyltransferase-2